MAKIQLDLTHMNVAQSIPYLEKIVGKTTGNAKFIDLAADALKLDTAVKALDTANTGYETSKKTTATALLARDNAFDAASASAHALASGAMKITTDAGDLTSGGWDLASDGAPVGQLAPPANFHATTGDMTGAVDLAWDTQRGVQTHIAHYATAPTGPWTLGYVGKKSSCTIPNLPSGVEHWFRVQANGAAGASDWAGPISKRPT
jgi:hypothetical protein